MRILKRIFMVEMGPFNFEKTLKYPFYTSTLPYKNDF